ncbi:MAG TPA: SMP-30/gluconolactonase/LRE family protein [Prochlorococcus sp.]|nr:SMP-30/gluconolactonase/LRE family protein [Prochlorococcus sp.]
MSSLTRWSADCVLDAKTGLGEGPVWWTEQNCLLWVDIEACRVGIFDFATRHNRWLDVGSHVGCVTPTVHGDLLLACVNGFYRLNLANGELTVIEDPEASKVYNRFNDGKCDPWGCFWAGTMAYDFSPAAGSLYRLNPSGIIECMLTDISISNGLAWDQKARLFYYIDTPTLDVQSYVLTEDGQLGEALGPCIQIPPEWDAVSDGMSLDQEGMLWIALFGGSSVGRWNPVNGELLGLVDLPCRQVTSCCFGGPQFDQLFITTARREMTSEQCDQAPLAGGLFVADVKIRGQASCIFSG